LACNALLLLFSLEENVIAVVEPIHFLKQSQTDIKACNQLYGSGDYGNAAYHLQQAVEKHVKCILLAGGLMPKRKTHLSLSEFLEEFISGIADFKNIAEKYNVQIFDSHTHESTTQFLDQSRIIIEALAEGKASFLSALWKNSLNIPLVDRQEEAVFQQCPIFRRHAKLKITILRGFESETDRDNFDNDPQIKRLHYYKPIVELGPTIAATHPHAEVGRYPTDINTTKGVKNSVELYEERKGELRKLIDQVVHTLRSS
jgi:HEPN domain-containing protein